MKKKAIIAAVSTMAVILCALSAVLVWQLTACGTVCVDGKRVELSPDETRQFRQALKRDAEQSSGGGFGRFTSYGCGFSEDFSIRIGGLTYCFGQDGCPRFTLRNWITTIARRRRITRCCTNCWRK